MSAVAPTVRLADVALRRALGLLTALLAVTFLVAAAEARADTPSTLTVVGTSDVQDSGLMPQLITPMFEKAYPQFTLKFVSVGSGVAINDAESGVASVLLVHAPSLENQFVAQGFSREPFGRAVFYGDYVLLGPASDPAGVLSGAPHDMASAFARIAAAGAAGKADFVSRGGTPGTTVEEHGIWALDAGTPGLTLCTVSAANGGGQAPSTAGGACPTTTSNPAWYHTTGLTQGPNIEAANTCNFTNAGNNGGNDCYVLTDRGTFQCLTNAACAGGSAAPSNLRIASRDNSATAKGGANLLINSFHAYAVSPAKFAGNPNVQINATAAEDFLNFLTSAQFQTQLKSFLGSTNDPPFIADAAPKITATAFPGRVRGGKTITVTGTIANLVPGTPPLANQTVGVNEVLPGGLPGLPIASAKTDSTGAYRITFSPTSTGSYEVTTSQITQVENSALNPPFADLLGPGSTASSKVTVEGAIQGLSVKGLPGRVLVTGSVLPGSGHANGSVVLLGRAGRKGPFRKLATSRLRSGDHAFAISAAHGKGTLFVKVRYLDPGIVLATTSRARKVSVPARDAASVTVTSFTVRNGRFTLSGRIGPQPRTSGTVVQVLGLDAGPLKPSTTPAGDSARFAVIATVRMRPGANKFTVRGRLRRGQHWILEAKYAAGGTAGSGYGGLRSVNVS